MFETGPVFWIVIAYSFIGYALFVAGSTLVVRSVMNKKEISIKPSQATMIISLFLVAAIATGPLSWFMTIKTIRGRIQAR
jgi:hypothetical protein